MSAPEWAFSVMAVIGSLAAIRVVTAKNVVHAALYLVVTLASVGGVYLILAAEFVAWVQILIYVGAIVILFLFGLMLTKAPIGRDTSGSGSPSTMGRRSAGSMSQRAYVCPMARGRGGMQPSPARARSSRQASSIPGGRVS